MGRISEISVQGEKITLEVRNHQDESFIGDSTFIVAIYDDGTLIREIPVRVRMEAALDVVISTKYLQRDSEIGYSDVKLVRKWFSRMPAHVVTQIEDAVGKQLYSDVKQNTEIKRNMLKSVKTIRRGKMVKILPKDWESLYHHPLYYLETFVDQELFHGTCYRAANWLTIGQTTGRGKNDQTGRANRSLKAVLGYPLSRDFRDHLCGGQA